MKDNDYLKYIDEAIELFGTRFGAFSCIGHRSGGRQGGWLHAHCVEHKDKRSAQNHGTSVVEASLADRSHNEDEGVDEYQRKSDTCGSDESSDACCGHCTLQNTDGKNVCNQREYLFHCSVQDAQPLSSCCLYRVTEECDYCSDDEHQWESQYRNAPRKVQGDQEESYDSSDGEENSPPCHSFCLLRNLLQDFFPVGRLRTPSDEDDADCACDEDRYQEEPCEAHIRHVGLGCHEHGPEVDRWSSCRHDCKEEYEDCSLLLADSQRLQDCVYDAAEDEDGYASGSSEGTGDEHEDAHDAHEKPLVVDFLNDSPGDCGDGSGVSVDVHKEGGCNEEHCKVQVYEQTFHQISRGIA